MTCKPEDLVEAVLFLESDPVDVKTLARKTSLEEESVEKSLEILTEKYREGGISIMELEGTWLMTPSKESWEELKDVYGKKNDDKLSKAALETLSIIAYSQPVTKVELENMRGVSADGMIRLLLKRKLIKVVGKKEVPGKPALYGTTKDFLNLFNLKSISELPKLSEEDKERFELNG